MADSDPDRPLSRRLRDRLDPETSRRQFLRAAVNVGFGAGMAHFLSVEDVLGAPSGEVPIVYGFARTDPGDPASLSPRTTTVPAEWYDRMRYAFEMHRKLRAAETPGILDSFVSPGKSAVDVSIAVRAADATARERIRDLGARLSESVGGLTFEVTERTDASRAAPSGPSPTYVGSISDHRPPSGVAVAGSHGLGTLSPALYDTRSGRRFFTTSNHLYGEKGAKRTQHRGTPLWLVTADRSASVGAVRRGFPAADFVRVEPIDEYAPPSRILGADPERVDGHFTRYGLADLKARGEPLRKVGALSGHTEGRIKGIDGVTCFAGEVCKRGQLEWGDQRTITDGDSGSVSYHPDPERPEEAVMIASIDNARTWWPGSDYTWGTAAYHIYNRYGFSF
ncbi:MAG: hypothetical protein ABEJ28_01090 [Salinigranum sp.]